MRCVANGVGHSGSLPLEQRHAGPDFPGLGISGAVNGASDTRSIDGGHMDVKTATGRSCC